MTDNMKKCMYAVLLVVCLYVLTVTAAAEEISVSSFRNEIRYYDKAYDRMYRAVAAGEEEADLSGLSLRLQDVRQIYEDLRLAAPEFFYLDDRITYYYRSDTLENRVTKVRFSYEIKGQDLEGARQAYEQELSYIVSLTDPDWSELEKALWVHDYFAASFSYDEKEELDDAYALFRERKGICQAYALAYAAVLRELGMEAVVVSSKEMNHAWNLVQVDGAWYHVDLVYDDPAPDRLGRVQHTYFLLDDAGIQTAKEPHTGWNSTIACTSALYADAFWRDVTSRMLVLDGRWYYIDRYDRLLVSSDITGRGREDIYHFEDYWMVEGDAVRYWVGVFSGVSSMYGYIFMNTPYEVLLYNPHTGQMNVYLEAKPGERIFGSLVYKNALEFLLAEAPAPGEDEELQRISTFLITDFPMEEGGAFPFRDVSPLDACYDAVRYVYRAGLFQGVSADKFAPYAPLTRAMFVTVLGRLCGIVPADYPGVVFDDVEEESWYAPYVAWAAENNLVHGVGERKFLPEREVTRQEMLKITAQLGIRMQCGKMTPMASVLPFDDAAELASWAADSAAYCVQNDLLDTGGKLRPAEPASRAQAAEILARFASLAGLDVSAAEENKKG